MWAVHATSRATWDRGARKCVGIFNQDASHYTEDQAVNWFQKGIILDQKWWRKGYLEATQSKDCGDA
jgi:hypothetical protein